MSGINTRCRTRAVPTRSLLKSLFGRGDGVSIHRSGSSRNIDPHWNISDTLYRKQTCIGETLPLHSPRPIPHAASRPVRGSRPPETTPQFLEDPPNYLFIYPYITLFTRKQYFSIWPTVFSSASPSLLMCNTQISQIGILAEPCATTEPLSRGCEVR